MTVLPRLSPSSMLSQVTDGCSVGRVHYNGGMRIVEIAFFSAAAIMGVITAVAVFTLIKRVERDKKASDAAEKEATR